MAFITDCDSIAPIPMMGPIDPTPDRTDWADETGVS